MQSNWKWMGGALVILLLGALPLLLVSTAQNTGNPTATQIPILDDATPEGSAPTLGDAPATGNDTDSGAPATTGDGQQAASPDVSGDICPTGVADSFSAANFVCDGVRDGEACLAFGSVNAVVNANAQGETFANNGDIIPLNSLSEINLQSVGTANNFWTTVVVKPTFNTTDGNRALTADMIAFGDMTLVDTGEVATGGAASGRVTAERGLIVRRAPDNNGVVVYQLQAGESIQVTGRTADRVWLRIQIPTLFAGTGWVYAPYIDVEGGQDALPFVNANSPAPDLEPPRFGPMQSFLLLSQDTPPQCGSDIPDSGMLVQSPNGVPDAIAFRVNDVEIQLNGTAFLQAQTDDFLSISVLEGDVTVLYSTAEASASAGIRLNIPLDDNLDPVGAPQRESLLASTSASLPLSLLARQFGAPSADTGANPAPTDVPQGFGTPPVSDTTDAQSFGTPAGQDTSASADPACTLRTPDELRNVRRGPGLLYDVVNVIQPNRLLVATGRASDQFGMRWYQVEVGGFMRSDTVVADGDCDALPTVEPPPLPTATPTPPPDPTAAPSVSALESTALGTVECPGGTVTTSTTATGADATTAIGGTWSATSDTSIFIQTQGGQLQPDITDYIRVQDAETGTVVAASGNENNLSTTFQQDTIFEIRMPATAGSVLIMSVQCNG
jgi:uncharacterized protein YgiM (DUF1202 family)